MNITPDQNDKNLLHVTVSGYEFDTDNYIFPDRWAGNANKSINANVGYFSVGYVQVLCSFPDSTNDIKNVSISLKADNFSATSMSGNEITEEALSSDNLSRTSVTTYPSGSHSKRSFFYSATGAQLASVWSLGDSYAYLGQQIRIAGHMVYTGDAYLTDTNILQKFDDEAFEVPKGTTSYLGVQKSNGLTVVNNVTTLFAAKPDKTGWTSDDEMNNTHEEQLIYFKGIDDLNNAGYTCVGILYEVRNSQLYPNNGGGCISFHQLFNMKKDVKAGKVYMTNNDVRSWQTNDTVFSWEDMTYDETIKAYGAGLSTWTKGQYVTGYTVPKYEAYLPYGKAIYENGTMVGGHTNGYGGGNSLLIIGNKVVTDIAITDEDSNVSKSTYDLDAGERTVSFIVNPMIKIGAANSEIMTSGATDNITVKIKLPPNIYFNQTGVSKEPYQVNETESGTEIIWKYDNIKLSEIIDAIRFTATIGEEGTKNDVVNNQTFVVSASITSDNDIRSLSIQNGNYAEVSFSVIKLAASSVTKRAVSPLVDEGQDLVYRLRYSNLSEVDADNVNIYDVLPYVGDGRGTSFTGKYKVTSVKMDLTNASLTLSNCDEFKMDYTESENGKQENTISATLKNSLDSSFSSLQGNINEKYVEWNDISIEATALHFNLDHVYGNEYIDIYITLSPLNGTTFLKDEKNNVQQPGDIYANSFSQYAENQAAVVKSNVVDIQVVKRELSGIAWIDKNKNGLRESSENVLSDISVDLYQVAPTDAEPSLTIPEINVSLSPAYNVFGEKIVEVKTDSNGKYQFENLSSGLYYVVFSDTEGYGVTSFQLGSDKAIDSDIHASVKNIPLNYEDIRSALSFAYISDIEMPEIKNMPEYSYSLENEDAGFTELPSPSQAVAKIAARTTGAKFENSTGRYTGDKVSGNYANGERVNYTISVTNTGVCDLYDLVIKDSFDEAEGYLTDLKINNKESDILTSSKKQPVHINSIANDGTQAEITLDKLAAGDSVELLCSALANNATAPTKDIKNNVSLSSNFIWDAELDKLQYECSTPDTIINNVNYSKDYDEINLVPRGNVTIKKISDTETPLSNVSFKLEGDDGTVISSSTDENGQIVFKNLIPQHYILTEENTASGNQLLSENVDITLPLIMTKEEAEQAHADISKAGYDEATKTYYFYDLTYTIKNGKALSIVSAGGNLVPLYALATIFFGFAIGFVLSLFIFKTKRK